MYQRQLLTWPLHLDSREINEWAQSIYTAILKRLGGDVFSIKGVTVAGPFSPVPRDAVSHFCLLLGSLYQR